MLSFERYFAGLDDLGPAVAASWTLKEVLVCYLFVTPAMRDNGIFRYFGANELMQGKTLDAEKSHSDCRVGLSCACLVEHFMKVAQHEYRKKKLMI